MRPLLDNPARPFKSAVFSVVTAPNGIEGRAAVNHRYRYIRWTGPKPGEELYDRQTDPREFTNLAALPQHKPTLTRMRAILDAGWKAARARL
jgi:hypothetical protein